MSLPNQENASFFITLGPKDFGKIKENVAMSLMDMSTKLNT